MIDRQTGLLISIKSPEAIAQAIITYKNDPQLRANMAENGYQHIANNFTVENTVDETLAMYETLKNELL